jgi:osmotically inducible protein OsmC
MNRTASAHWSGALKDGSGTLTAPGGVLKSTPYSFATRFDGKPGTNPEELIAAAHAACFSMSLSRVLGTAGFTPTSIDTNASVTIESVGGGFAITAIHLNVDARVPGITDQKFQAVAAEAKANCPVSKVLNAKITMEARLVDPAG